MSLAFITHRSVTLWELSVTWQWKDINTASLHIYFILLTDTFMTHFLGYSGATIFWAPLSCLAGHGETKLKLWLLFSMVIWGPMTQATCPERKAKVFCHSNGVSCIPQHRPEQAALGCSHRACSWWREQVKDQKLLQWPRKAAWHGTVWLQQNVYAAATETRVRQRDPAVPGEGLLHRRDVLCILFRMDRYPNHALFSKGSDFEGEQTYLGTPDVF